MFSPSQKRAVITDRAFSENPEHDTNALLTELEALLEAEIIVIPSLAPRNDMTGHADGVVRFVNENTVLGNASPYKNGYEQKVKRALKKHGIAVIDFPYFDSAGMSAVGSYLNFLETETHLFLPVFGDARDAAAAAEAALAGAGGMEGVLGTVADGLTGQQRQDYNPLEAYQSLMEWLG